MAIFSSCAGLGAGVMRNHKNKKAGDEVREQVKIGDDIYATADRLRKAGWDAPDPTFASDEKKSLRCYVKVGKDSFFAIMQEVCGHSPADAVPAHVFIKASPNGKITSVE